MWTCPGLEFALGRKSTSESLHVADTDMISIKCEIPYVPYVAGFRKFSSIFAPLNFLPGHLKLEQQNTKDASLYLTKSPKVARTICSMSHDWRSLLRYASSQSARIICLQFRLGNGIKSPRKISVFDQSKRLLYLTNEKTRL